MKRIHALDSVRGIAALIVVFGHLALVNVQASAALYQHQSLVRNNPWTWLYDTPASILVNGAGAVMIFFVLSGLVLALTFIGSDDERAAPFLIKRVFRVWPPFAIAILISALLEWLTKHGPYINPSEWMRASWDFPPTADLILRHLDLTQTLAHTTEGLDNPMWTLVHEMRVSLIFPLLIALVIRKPVLTSVFGALLVPISVMIVLQRHGYLVTSLASTGEYLFAFVTGAVMATHLNAIKSAVSKLTTAGCLTLAAVGFLFESFAISGIAYTYQVAAGIIVATAGAAILVGLCTADSAVATVLKTPIPMWLGRVSYSLYLIHVPVLLSVFYLFPKFPFFVNASIAITTSFVAAELLNRAVEKPSMRLGRAIAGIASRREGHPGLCMKRGEA